MTHPLAVNYRISFGGKFPIVFETVGKYHMKGVSDKLVATGKITTPLNTFVVSTFSNTTPWETTEDKVVLNFTKIENDIPVYPISPQTTNKASDVIDPVKTTKVIYGMGPLGKWSTTMVETDSWESNFPVVKLPNSLGKYWIIPKYDIQFYDLYCTPELHFSNGDGFKYLRQRTNYADAATGTVINYAVNNSASINYTVTGNGILSKRHYTIINKLPELKLPIRYNFTTKQYDYKIYEPNLLHGLMGGTTTKYSYIAYNVALQEQLVSQASGTKAIYFNYGKLYTKANYFGPWTKREEIRAEMIFTDDIKVYNDKNSFAISNQLPYLNHLVIDGYKLETKDTAENYNMWMSDKLIYEWCFPREYGLKGIKFSGPYLEHKIDSFTMPTGNGSVVIDRFRVKLPYPMATSIEITKEPTSWDFGTGIMNITTNSGWVGNGYNEPGAYQSGGKVNGALPPGIRLVRANGNMASNTTQPKYIGAKITIINDNKGKNLTFSVDKSTISKSWYGNSPVENIQVITKKYTAADGYYQSGLYGTDRALPKGSDVYVVEIRETSDRIHNEFNRWMNAKNRHNWLLNEVTFDLKITAR